MFARQSAFSSESRSSSALLSEPAPRPFAFSRTSIRLYSIRRSSHVPHPLYIVPLSHCTSTILPSISPPYLRNFPHTPFSNKMLRQPSQKSTSPTRPSHRSLSPRSSKSLSSKRLQHRRSKSPHTNQTSLLSTATPNVGRMSQTYDLAVIGGGSGGLAAAKEAARFGKKVVVFDFVKPSPQGSKWGLGGTCVNVGCVPKKLMHYAGLIGATLHHDAEKYGWKLPESGIKHDWSQLVETVQNHVHSLNFSYRSGLRSAQVEYINAHAEFVDAKTLKYTFKGQEKSLIAETILIATGGRPVIPEDVKGAREYAITSDDVFSRELPPNKTLVVGASYIALECAGFITELGYDCTVAVRSILLRGFDRDAAQKIEDVMRCNGTKFVNKLPKEISPVSGEENLYNVTFTDGSSDTFNTILYATGRYADTAGVKLANAGVTSLANGKFAVNDQEQTNIPHIYAIGDILQGRPELTPVAIKTGELLSRRLFGGATQKMNWDLIPTTVFTPVEYGTIGLSEEDAIARFGAENIRTYLTEFTGLEQAAAHRQKVASQRADEFDVDMPPTSFAKLVCLKNDNEKVIGFHFVGDAAGEVTQGYAVALKLGATKADFEDTLSIHPTNAEAIIQISVTRESGESWTAAGGCGGGKCG